MTATTTTKQSRFRNGVLVWNLPPDLKKRFKLTCAYKSTTMRNVIIEMIKKYVEANPLNLAPTLRSPDDD